ncbi:ATPase family AAA domain-containing protein 2 [Planoprotostelium fungivorum]|uniref:ATPase family AAA domain-containing protein 2 n=1 Tax=Planoprotostelium fungivorum TaxID=1890364 RepID=A0A2P6NBY3_9EUKA|nr:ATPase family AAA domain-containing protein 2 [Planoprotostelium fungivorum]
MSNPSQTRYTVVKRKRRSSDNPHSDRILRTRKSKVTKSRYSLRSWGSNDTLVRQEKKPRYVEVLSSDEENNSDDEDKEEINERSDDEDAISRDDDTRDDDLVDDISNDFTPEVSNDATLAEEEIEEEEEVVVEGPKTRFRARKRKEEPKERRSARKKTSIERLGIQASPRKLFKSKPRRGKDSSDDDLFDLLSPHTASKLKLGMPQPINRKADAKDKADVDPMSIDPSVTWDSVGGLDQHIQQLKEMIAFPLLYPEVYERFQVTPPRGVLFYGPPGTGKTLVARALANMCSTAAQPVAFFMRKGADCLSKWVGEAERQLRLLFQRAHELQPAIIFFDEIDGLAPVRSSRQDQVHSSLVSTLLALMDGLDSRGHVMVVGATNRIDAIDPALRRPGRFDREFLFGLPTREDRRKILGIHTKEWKPPLESAMVKEIADLCVGYCGADLKALASEAALRTLRRTYPQIYNSKDKLLIDVSKLTVDRQDFDLAMGDIVPTAHRAAVLYARPLDRGLSILLQGQIEDMFSRLDHIFPVRISTSDALRTLRPGETLFSGGKSVEKSTIFRPRMVITGQPGMGQTNVAAALLHRLEQFPVTCIDMSELVSHTTARSVEEAFVSAFREALRKVPSVIFLPHLDSWWDLCTLQLRSTFENVMSDVEAELPVLVLSTTDRPSEELTPELKKLFRWQESHVTDVLPPSEIARKNYFSDIIDEGGKYVSPSFGRKKVYPELPKAPIIPRTTTHEQKAEKEREDTHYLRELRIFLRDVIRVIQRERHYTFFYKPLSREQFPAFYDAVEHPLDMNVIAERIDADYYLSTEEFIADVDKMLNDVRENSHLLGGAKNKLAGKAKALRDIVLAMLHTLNPTIDERCKKIAREKKEEGKSEENNGITEDRGKIESTTVQRPQRQESEVIEDDGSGLDEDHEVSIKYDRVKMTSYVERVARCSADHSIEELICLHADMMKIVHRYRGHSDKSVQCREMKKFVTEKFSQGQSR